MVKIFVSHRNRIRDIAIESVETHYPAYRQAVLDSLPSVSDPETSIRKIIERNTFSLMADNQYIAPAALVKNVLMQRVQPSKETHMGRFFESVMVDVAKGYYEHRGCTVVVPERTGDSADLHVSPAKGTRGLIAKIKSGINWANSQSKTKFNHKMAAKAVADCDLIEGIVCACAVPQTRYVGNTPIIRLCGVDLFERLCGDRSIGQLIGETIRSIESEELFKSTAGDLNAHIERHIECVIDAILGTYRNGYRGLKLWEGKEIFWDNLQRLNSGDWTADLFGQGLTA